MSVSDIANQGIFNHRTTIKGGQGTKVGDVQNPRTRARGMGSWLEWQLGEGLCPVGDKYTHPIVTRKVGTGSNHSVTSHSVCSWHLLLAPVH